MRVKGKDTNGPEQDNEASIQHWRLLRESYVIGREFVLRKEHQIMNVSKFVLSTACLLAAFFTPGCIIISETAGVEIDDIEIDSLPPELFTLSARQ